ncbi:MAG: TetR/AcrR family transcriptional regulator [Spirochaetales bacterium]|nr:TetR/AcrR family transcriptional regulator [Spirochaetales bacterium]
MKRNIVHFKEEKLSTSRKKEQIIYHAKALFLKYSPKKVNVEEICHEAKVSKVTFYKYFKNKSELLNVIRDELMDLGFSKFDEISAMNIPYPDKINLMSEWRIKFFSSLNGNFLGEILELELVAEESKKRFLKNIEAAQSSNEIKPDLSPDLIWLITEKMNEITRDGSWKKIFNNYADYQDQLRTIMFFGMLSNEK